jgi:flagellar hook-basal body protein
MPRATRHVDLSQGELKSTGQPTDLAIQGPGFFQVRAADGKPAYTRDGEFHTGADGNIINKMGYPVLSQDGSPLHVEKKTAP